MDMGDNEGSCSCFDLSFFLPDKDNAIAMITTPRWIGQDRAAAGSGRR
jgi:hypothetical protein